MSEQFPQPIVRPRFTGKQDPHRLMESAVSTMPIDDIREETGASTLLSPGHIIFYKAGEFPVHTPDRVDFCNLMGSSHEIVLVLNIRKDCPIPNCWISTLKKLEQKYPCFKFVRLQDIDAQDSMAIVYINGEVWENHKLAHSRQICLDEDAITSLFEPLILHHNLSKIQKSTARKALSAGQSVKINIPQAIDADEEPQAIPQFQPDPGMLQRIKDRQAAKDTLTLLEERWGLVPKY